MLKKKKSKARKSGEGVYIWSPSCSEGWAQTFDTKLGNGVQLQVQWNVCVCVCACVQKDGKKRKGVEG